MHCKGLHYYSNPSEYNKESHYSSKGKDMQASKIGCRLKIRRSIVDKNAISCISVGYIDLNVAIRTAEFRGPGSVLHDADADAVTVEAGVGGGITIDSDPDAEWAEILAKAAPLIEPA